MMAVSEDPAMFSGSAGRVARTDVPYALFWWVVFAYAASAAAFVQLVALPYLFPYWHVGSGLLAGMDSVAYHAQAADLADQIRSGGWSAWEIRPHGHFSVGVAAAVYALTVSEPWVVIPLNAGAHALSAVVLLRIFLLISPNWRWGIIATLPFAFAPSAANWYAQLLKDGYFFVGVLIFAYGWMVLAQVATWQENWHRPARGVLWTVIGFSIIGLVRPFSLPLILSSAGLLFLVYTAFQSLHAVRHVLSTRRAMTAVGVVGVCLMILAGVKTYAINLGEVEKTFTQTDPSTRRIEVLWGKSPEDPSFTFIDRKLVAIASVRYGYANVETKPGSLIDADVQFGSTGDIVRYVPRATQIAFLAPFPYHWFGKGTFGSTTLMRRISMFEMLLVYMALAILPFALWRYRGRCEVWVLMTFCTSIMIIYALAIPNIGTLYRIRYGYLMPLVGLGILGGLMAWESLQGRWRATAAPQRSGAD